MPPIDFNSLDTTIHGPVRLGVLTALHIVGPLDFTTLKTRLNVTDGAMGLHLQKLEKAGYISCKKAFIGRRPKSTYSITSFGREKLNTYIASLRQLLDTMEEQQELRDNL